MDSMIGMSLPDVERCSPLVVVVRGLNPGLMTGPGTNTYLVGAGDQPILIDAGAGAGGYLPLLEHALETETRARRPGALLVTHAHPDHLGGAADVLRRFGVPSVGKLPWERKDGRFPVEIRGLRSGDVIETDGARLRALSTPGHSPDHLCFYLEEERALFTGDVILGAGTSVIPVDGGDMAEYLASLRRILELDLELLYPGHGPPIRDARLRVEHYLRHRHQREARILRAVAEGASSLDQIVARAYRDTPRLLHPAAAQSATSHLVKLEREHRASRSVDASGTERWSPA